MDQVELGLVNQTGAGQCPLVDNSRIVGASIPLDPHLSPLAVLPEAPGYMTLVIQVKGQAVVIQQALRCARRLVLP